MAREGGDGGSVLVWEGPLTSLVPALHGLYTRVFFRMSPSFIHELGQSFAI